MAEASTEEKNREFGTAISKYLQAAEILLLLAKSEQGYTAWKNYADRAAYCQQKVRSLIALAPKADNTA